MRNFSQSFVKIALYGVVGSERTIKRVWDTSQQANLSGKLYGRADLRKRVPIVLARNVSEETAAYILENNQSLTGIGIGEDWDRVYTGGEAFSIL